LTTKEKLNFFFFEKISLKESCIIFVQQLRFIANALDIILNLHVGELFSLPSTRLSESSAQKSQREIFEMIL
jgi:hypothetical protein